MRQSEAELPIGLEFITGDPEKGETHQKYTVVGVRSDQVVLMAEGLKDGPYDKAIVENLKAIEAGVLARQRIIKSISPGDKLAALKAGEEITGIAPPEWMDAYRVDMNELRLGDPYLLRAKRVDGELAVLSAGFAGVEPSQKLLNFDMDDKRSGKIPIRAGRNSLITLDVQQGELSLPSGLVIPRSAGLPAIGVTLWRSLRPSAGFTG